MPDKRLFIYCAGGQGREVLKTVRAINQVNGKWNKIIFIDDNAGVSCINDTPVMPFSACLDVVSRQTDSFHIASGEPVLRKKITEKLKQHSLTLQSLVHPSIVLTPFQTIGEGVFIGEGVVLSDNLKIGNCICLNANATIGHNAVIEDYVTISPGAIISGDVTIGNGTYIGTGVIIRDEVKIGKDCIIGMGSLVTKDIPDGVVAYGSPCKIIRENQDGIVFR